MKWIYLLIQFTWGLLQSLLGLFVFLVNFRSSHYFYYGAIVTEWNLKSSVSLGCFIFIPVRLVYLGLCGFCARRLPWRKARGVI